MYLTGGFKKPRELTWITGVVMAVITVSFGVTGYSLPWDQVGYWAVKIVSGVPDAIPVVGGLMVELIRGGVSVGQPDVNEILQSAYVRIALADGSLYAACTFS